MKPYYQDDFTTLYHGDARELMPSVGGDFNALVTDPPWGTGWVRGGGAVGEFNAKHEQPEWDVWSTDWLHLNKNVRGGAIFSPLARARELRGSVVSGATVYWRKTNPRPNGPDRDAITVWPHYLPAGIEYRAYNGDTPLHPCQKDLGLMIWVLGFVSPRLCVIDPFAGSGSTLMAAKQLLRHSVGIEQDESYCETAALRLSQGMLFLGGAA